MKGECVPGHPLFYAILVLVLQLNPAYESAATLAEQLAMARYHRILPASSVPISASTDTKTYRMRTRCFRRSLVEAKKLRLVSESLRNCRRIVNVGANP